MPDRRAKRRKLSKKRLLLRKKASLNGNSILNGSSPSPSPHPPGWGPEGAINAYVCTTCHNLTITQNISDGITPKYMACQAIEECEGTGRSMNYPPNPPQKVIDRVRWEWYLPGLDEFENLTPDMQEFVKKGGLVLRAKKLESESEENNVDS